MPLGCGCGWVMVVRGHKITRDIYAKFDNRETSLTEIKLDPLIHSCSSLYKDQNIFWSHVTFSSPNGITSEILPGCSEISNISFVVYNTLWLCKRLSSKGFFRYLMDKTWSSDQIQYNMPLFFKMGLKGI